VDEGDDPSVVDRPIVYSEGRAWWFLGDNWEVTVLFICFGLQLTTAATSAGLGGAFRRPLWANYTLVVCLVLLYTIFVGMLLLPPSRLTATLHIASIAFNSAGTENPVWAAYQAACPDGEDCTSPGMPLRLRGQLLAIIAGGNALVLCWERLVVLGPVRNWLHAKFVTGGPAASRGQIVL
jgi:hypothetical protein